MIRKSATFVLLVLLTGCSGFDFSESVRNVKFNLAEVKSVRFCGVDFKGKEKLKDFSVGEISKITLSLLGGKFPGQITFGVNAVNKGTNPDAFSCTEVAIKSFPYKLYLYNKEVITGNITKPVNFPAPGNNVSFEINADFDLIKATGDLGYKKLIETVLAIKNGELGTISAKITSRPVLTLPWGDYEFPDEIKLENKID